MYIYTSCLKTRSTQGCLFKSVHEESAVVTLHNANMRSCCCWRRPQTLMKHFLNVRFFTVPVSLFTNSITKTYYFPLLPLPTRRQKIFTYTTCQSDLQQQHGVSKMFTNAGSMLNDWKLYYS